MQITVKILQGAECQLEVSENTTVSMLKTLVESKLQVPKQTQKLVFRGKTLQDDETMTACKLTSGAKVFLITMKMTATPVAKTVKTEPPVATASPGSASPTAATAVKKETPADRWASLRKLAERHLGKELAPRVVTEFEKRLDYHLSFMNMDDIQRFCASDMKEF